MAQINQTMNLGAGGKPAPSLFDQARTWLNSERVEAICVVITFIAMMAGLVTGQTGFYVIAYLAGGAFGLQAGLRSLREMKIDVDLLMVLAALGAAAIGAPFEGAMLLFLFSLSNVLQAYAIGRTRNAIKALMKLRPEQAMVKRDGATMMLPIEQIALGDHMILRPGERVALDGVVIEGESSVDQSSLTGESMPVPKRVGSPVFAGTINQRGGLEVRITKLAQESTINKLIKLVEEAQSEKAPTERFLDKFEQYYALGVIGFTLLLIIVPTLFLGEAFQSAFYRAMTVMVGASPCALIISTPASILSAIGNGARKGILYKGGAHLEKTADIKVVAFDKTGTLTVGQPSVTDVTIIPLFADQKHYKDSAPLVTDTGNPVAHQENVLLTLAAAVEAKSEHPLAQAIVNTAKVRGLALPQVNNFQATTGKGVRGQVQFMGGLDVCVGSPRYFAEMNPVGMVLAMKEVERLQDEGKTSVIVARVKDAQAVVLGVIAIADIIREDAPHVIRDLKELGVQRVIMLTGDNARVAKAIAKQVGVDEFYADLLPEDKVRMIKDNAQYGPVAMVGDGVNDAPALATAAVGMAMGAAGTDVALETADVVLMSDDLKNIPYAIALSRQARKVVIQNIVFACAVIVVLVVGALGFNLLLPLGVVGHEGSTVLVCLNGLRLLGYRRKR
jgi:Cd2+/Zn2+-exporting ATPase